MAMAAFHPCVNVSTTAEKILAANHTFMLLIELQEWLSGFGLSFAA